jgi:hypothetical protein
LLEKLKLVNALPVLDQVPKELTGQAQRIFRPAGKRPDTSVKELVATLLYDSKLKPAVATMRSVGALDRQMLFRTDDYHIDFRISQLSDEGQFIVSGQMLPRKKSALPPCRFEFCLVSSKGVVKKSNINDLGEFQLDGIESASYEVYLTGPEQRISVTTFDLEQR